MFKLMETQIPEVFYTAKVYKKPSIAFFACFELTSCWETSVPIEEPILPFKTLPPPVIVPGKQRGNEKQKPSWRDNC